MKEIKARLIERIKRTNLVESFRFLLSEKINFLPGQFLRVIFERENRENKELNKYLSISCSPTKEYIEVTKRMSNSGFSQRLGSLRLNDEIFVEIPLGNCVFQEEYKKIGFLIGGIGITPVISIIEYIIDKKLDTDVCLFYSNRTDDNIAFKEELGHWQTLNKNIKIYFTVTDYQPKDKTSIFGFINKELLIEKACDLDDRIFFIFGPPRMVDAMCNILLELECKKENIRTEKFIGY